MTPKLTQTPPLNPPYDGHAVWHEHAFPPDGKSFPERDEEDCRYDAVEDRYGRIFVWHVGSHRIVCVCGDREMATAIARCLARESVHFAEPPTISQHGKSGRGRDRMPDTNEITVADATQTTINRLRELLSDQIEEWRIDREPHKYRDGTNHFTHVRYTAYDCDGTPMPVEVGSYLTDDLAELLVTAKNNLPELLRLAAIGLKAEDAKR